MLELRQIVKDYPAGTDKVTALKGIDLAFRNSEFVSILGPSGCGKTTMLNIIGGLDQYTSGDLVINNISTKSFKDRDWDAYRNHSVGFVFQSYNLIPHQSVLQNVEIALSLSGVLGGVQVVFTLALSAYVTPVMLGGGRVVVPAGEHFSAGPLRLRSNIELHLEEGARIVFSDNPQDYLPAVPTSWEGVECLNLDDSGMREQEIPGGVMITKLKMSQITPCVKILCS